MISKNSFWVRVRQNTYRRSWCFFIDMLVLLLIFPIVTLLSLSNVVQNYGAMRRLMLYEEALSILGPNIGVTIVTFILAIIAGIQGFSYLHDRKKVDMYHSQPVSEKQRFFSVWLNGILLYVISYAVCVLLSFLEAALYHAVDFKLFLMMLIAFGINLFFFAAVYAVVCCAVLLTGNRVSCVLGSLVLLFYMSVLGGVLELCKSIFFKTESGSSRLRSMTVTGFPGTLSVPGFWAKYGNVEVVRETKVGEVLQQCRGLFLVLFMVAAIATVCAYILFKKRKGEMTSVSMAFPHTKVFIEVALCVPVGLFGGYFIQTSLNTLFFYLLGVVLGVALSHIVIQCIYEGDIKMIFRTWKVFLAGIGCCLVVFCFFYLDISGYDSYVPKAEELESAAVMLEWNDYLDLSKIETESKDLQNYSSWDYLSKSMYIKDTALISELAGANYFANEGKGVAARMSIRPGEGFNEVWGDKCYLGINVNYRFKNGSEKQRILYIDADKNRELLNRITKDRDYQDTVFQICDDRIGYREKHWQMYVEITDSMETKEVKAEQLAGLQEAYRKDLASYSYDLAVSELPVAMIQITANQQYMVTNSYIYKEYTNTLEYLAKENIFTGSDLEDYPAKSIDVYSQPQETEWEETGDYDSYVSEEEYPQEESVHYKDPEQIGQLKAVLIPELTTNLYSEYHSKKEMAENDVTIIMDETVMRLKDGAVLPDFVKEDLKKRYDH